MNAVAQRTIEADLDRLEKQRLGYAQALASSQDERVRARHERTLARLDEEIAALTEALESIAYPTSRASVEPQSRGHHGGVPILEQTSELTAAEWDELRPPRPKWIIPVAALGAVVVGGLLAWATLPDPPAPAKPTPAPAKVIVSSPVPPDSDATPAR
jgi:hypothetical protein